LQDAELKIWLASQRFSTRAGYRPVSPVLSNRFRTLRGSRASVDRVNVELYTFLIIVSKYEVWKGRHFIGRPWAAVDLAIPLCGTILAD